MENNDVLVKTIKDDTFYEICELKMWMNMEKDHVFFNRECMFRSRNDLDDYRFRNSILFFKLPQYEESFLLFFLGDIADFDVNNPFPGCEKYLRIAYVLKDEYGYDCLGEIKEEQALKDANEKVRRYLYEENDILRVARSIMQLVKIS